MKEKVLIKNKFLPLILVVLVFFVVTVAVAGASGKNNQNHDGVKFSLNSARMDFAINERAEFEFAISKERNIIGTVGAFFKGFFIDEYKDVDIKARLKGEKEKNFDVQVNYGKNGKFTVDLSQMDKQIKPGRHEVEIVLKGADLTGDKDVVFVQNFTWGVLAFNANKAIYKPGDSAYLQFGVLDDEGHTICDADLEVEIIGPKGGETLKTSDGTITRNPDCGADNVISTPDYYAYYALNGTGEYVINIKATTKNGDREISDKVEVKDYSAFEVERIGPTRINPTSEYGMFSRILINENFSGDIIDSVPLDFEIKNAEAKVIRNKTEVGNQQLEIENTDEEKNLILKNIVVNQGDTIEITYKFDAPDIYPELYLIGPLLLHNANNNNVVFSEARQWQIASDGNNQVIVAERMAITAGTADTTNWTNVVVASSTSFTGGNKYFVYVTAGFSGSAAGVNTDFEVYYDSSTRYTGLIEASGDQAYDASQIAWFTVMDQPSTPTDIILRYRTNSGTSYAMNAQIIAINLSTLNPTDWKYVENSTVSQHTTTLVSRASTTMNIADGVKDWLVFGMEELVIDTINDNAEGELYNGTTAFMHRTVEGQDATEAYPYVLYAPFDNLALNTPLSIRVRDDTGGLNDHNKSRLFALNLNRFESFKTYYAQTNTTLAVVGTWYTAGTLNTGTNYAPLTSGNQLLFTSFIDDFTTVTNEVDNRLRVNAVTTPTSWSWVQGTTGNYVTGYDATDELTENIATRINIPSSGQTISLDARSGAGTTQILDEASLAVFSERLANQNRPAGKINSAVFRMDTSGKVDISIDVNDRDLDDLRVKVEYEAGSTCTFASHQKATISTVDADTTATYGDPDVDNQAPYQIGTTSAWILSSWGTSTIDFDWTSKSNIPNTQGVYCLKITANDGTNDQLVSATTTLTVDNLVPTISLINTYNKAYKIGDVLRATATVAVETGSLTIGPGSKINGVLVTNIQKTNNTTFTMDYTVVAGQTDRVLGAIPYVISLVDSYNNKSASSTGNLANGSVDANAPVISQVTAPKDLFGIGETFPITITVSSDTDTYAHVGSTINGKSVSNPQKSNNTTYTADYTVAEGDTDRASSTVPISIVLRDSAGNQNAAYTVLTSSASVDAHRPVIDSVFIYNGTYGIGDSIDLIIDADANFDNSGYLESAISVNGKSISGFSYNLDTTYNITYTVAEGDTDRAANTIPVSIVLRDIYGNANTVPFSLPSGNSATVDANRPKILSISLPNRAYKIGDTVRATTTVQSDTNIYTLGASTINNVIAGNLQKINDTTYTFDYTVVSGNTDRSAGTIPVSLILRDQISQENTPASTTAQANTASIDANLPSIASIGFLPSSGLMKVGDTATATIALNGAETGATAGANVKINNVDVKNTFTEIGGGNYRVVYTVAEGNDDHPDDDDLPVYINITDVAGNEASVYAVSDPTNRPGVDGHAPTISNVAFNITSGTMKIGDIATATITADASGYTANAIIINGVNVASTLASAGGSNYTVTYTVAEGHVDILDANDLPISISLRDSVGNNSAVYNTADSGNRPGVDGHAPTISNVAFNITSGTLKIGDIATATITADASGYTANVITINGINVASTLVSAGGSNYTVTYTVAEGHTDILDANNLPISISLRDSAGNNSSAYTTADSGNRPGVDGHTPVISSVVFVPSSGILKVGDTATATISVSGAESGLLIGGAMTINAIDVAGSFTDSGGGNYRVVYTVAESHIDINDIADLPVNFTLQDAAGNVSSAYTTADAANRPGVDGHTPNITVVNFNITSGILKIGDIATATISASGAETGLLAGNTMTINGVDVSSTFRSAGGGTYTVVYTVSQGNPDILDSNDLPVILSLQDAAGNQSNIYNADDPLNRPGVDAHIPVISNVVFNITSGILKIGATATATITADASGYTANTITINGVNVASTLASAGGSNYTVTYTVAEGHTDILDANNLPISISLRDSAGNNSSAYAASDSGNRPGVDGHAPTVPGNLSFSSHNNTSITVRFGATTTETNFSNYKIFYKIGIAGVSESDSEWNSSNDANLGNILFNGALTTTITGLTGERDYVFNIWAYDTAGNKSLAFVELKASTNYIPLQPNDLQQKLNDNYTVVSNDAWAIDQTMVLSASSTDPEGEFYDYYYEVISATGTLTTATSVPAASCNSGTGFVECAEKVWKYSTGPDWYDDNWLYRKQIVIDSDLVEITTADFPLLISNTDDDLQRNARSDGYDILFTTSDGVTKIDYERKLFDPATGQLIAWVETDISSTSDTFLYMYYGYAGVGSDQSTTTGVWDSSYLGVWHMDEAPTGSADDIKDSSGNNRHMTSYNMNSAKRVQTDTGYAYNFDGVGDYLEDADGENYINGLSQFTVELWLKSDVVASDRGFIIGSAPAGNDSYFTLRYDEAGANNGNLYHNLVKGAMTITGPTEKQYESSAGVQTTDWQHLVFRWTSGGQYEVLINGQDDAYTFNSPAGVGTTQGADRLRIGQGGKDIGTTLGWDGLIDEVRISNTYRSDAWEKTAYNNQSNLTSFALLGAQDAVRIFNLPESSTGYIWQVMTCDEHDVCSDWVKYNETTPNFKVDNTAPTAPGNLSEVSHTSTAVKLNFGATTTEAFFDHYEIHYKEYGGAAVSLGDALWGPASDSNLGDIIFNDEASTTVNFLTAGVEYQFNIWAIDESGQTASATPIRVTTASASNAPTSVFNSAAQKIDGSGTIDISIAVDDLDNNLTRVKMEYVAGAACNFASPLDPTLDENSANISASNEPAPYIDNQAEYQIGTGTNWILTSPSVNTINFDWLSMNDIPNASSTYCLRLTANDGAFTQTVLATTTVYIDNYEPTQPGALSLNAKNTNSLILNYGAAALEDNFSEYKIYYKAGASGVTESDTVFDQSNDINLSDQFFNASSTTMISGLNASTQYVFAVFAYDDYGNKASSTGFAAYTNFIPAAPGSLAQLKNDALTAIANGAWTNENTFRLRASALDSDTSEVITLYFELASTSEAFTGDTSAACSSSAAWGDCPSQVWSVVSAAGNYSVTPFTGTVNPIGVPDNYAGLKWQAQACDDDGACSAWSDAGAQPNFKVDHTNPTVPGNLSQAAYTSNSITLAFGNASSEANFREYIIYYKAGSSGVTELNLKHSSSTDINLSNRLFNGASQTTISGLNPGTQYVFNIWAYDSAGNKALAVGEFAITTNNKPTGSFSAANIRRDGSGRLDISILVDDADDNNSRARIDYAPGSSCNFSSPLDPSLDAADANATSTFGDAKIDNSHAYQVGTTSGWIVTASGANTVSFDWLSRTDLSEQAGIYCLRLIVNDGIENQAIAATTTVYIDNKAPSAPGNLSLARRTANSLDLYYGATSTETNFSQYRIFYKQGAASINEDGSQISDVNLSNILFNGKATTSVSGLLVNTQYSFKVYAYDTYGNKSNSGQVSFTTNAHPTGVFNSAAQKINGSGIVDISVEIYDINGDNVRAKLEFATGTSCIFSSGDTTLDETPGNISADYGLPGIENDNNYQIGTTTAMIITTSGSNTVNFDWLSKNNIPNASGSYCLRLTANDGSDNQTISATTTVVVDNKNPTVPGNLYDSSVGGISITLGYGAASNDDYFSEYKIFYKTGFAGVSESDTEYNQFDDLNLGAADFNEAITTTINNLSQSTQYVFNIWAYDLFGNKTSAAGEVSTSTIILSMATWRENMDIVDPTAGTYLGKEQTIRLRLVVANSGDWAASDYHYRLEYGQKDTDCASIGTWTTVPANANAEHFELMDSAYVAHGASTSNRLSIAELLDFTPGYVVGNTSTTSGAQTIPGSYFTELEYIIQPTAVSIAGETYCFRATDNGVELDNYEIYPEFTLAPPASATFDSAGQRTDGSGIVDFSMEVSDGDGDPCQVRVEYVNNTNCDFSTPLRPALDEADENISATFGDPDIDNDYNYQVGTASAMILTQNGTNTVQFAWPTISAFDGTDDDYCVRLTAFDGFEEQTIPATTTIIIDNLDPTTPGDLQYIDKTSNSVTIGLASFSSDRNFAEYKIFYKEGSSGVTESDAVFASSSDINLADDNWNGAPSVTVTGLSINKQYVFKLWAYDHYGNKSNTSNEIVVTLRYTAKSENWRWYYDQFNETPLSPASAEETAPVNISDGSAIKLRLALREVENITGSNIKMRLQYSTYSDFSADVHYVGEKASSSVIWIYGDGVDDDDDAVGIALLVGVVNGATHNESGTSVSSYTHLNNSSAEWEFTVKNNSAPNSISYYFRAYDVANGAPVELNSGFSYPSLTTEAGSLSFSASGFGSGGSTEGVTANIDTTPSSIPLGNLSLLSDAIGVQRFEVSTNAGSGYQLFVYQRQNLLAGNGADINPVSGENSTPDIWPATPNPSAFGYHTGDDTLSGSQTSRFAPNNTYAKFETSPQEISYSPIPVENEIVDLVFRVGVSNMQEAGEYETEIVYILVPTFY